jgi:DNA-binding NarL/FixJ family response regulator
MNKSSVVRVLVVDDFQPWLRFVTKMLGSEVGVQIVGTALNGPEAIAQASILRPDLVLMDVGLPNMSGIEAARHIISLNSNTKIIFVSLITDPEIVQAAFAVGGWGYIVKSNTHSELLVAMKTVVEGKRYVGRGLPGFNVTGTTDT